MVDLWLTVYGNTRSPLLEPSFLLDEFMFRRNANVLVSQMAFDEAWTKLLHYALYGSGPHISLIGSIWTSTLKPTNTLRPFSSTEVFDLGGAKAYFPGPWAYAMANEIATWSIPFEIYTHLVLYRRDLLAQAGIDEAGAFSSAGAMIDTVRRLNGAGIPSPLILPSGPPFPARPHLAASWLWGAGGEFIDEDEITPLFTAEPALRGLADFFTLYRLMSPTDRGLNAGQTIRQFVDGRAAAVIAGSNAQRDLLQANNPDVMENLGVVPLPGVPWIGGTNLVLWKEVCANPEQERAAVELAKFLNTPAAQNKTAAADFLIPARVDALAEHTFAVEAFRPAMEYTARFGRAYPTVELWMRIVNELRAAFDLVTEDALNDTDEEIEKILRARLEPLARRLRLMLE